MRGVFDDEELEQAKPGHDTELTLSSTMLLGMFFGLVLLCGLCFGLGYFVGHRRPQISAASGLQLAGGAETTAQTDSSRPKPPPGPASSAQPASNAAADLAASQDSGLNPAPSPQASEAAPSASTPGLQQVRPALPTPADAPLPPQSGMVASAVVPQPAPAGTLMVQIAAVTNPDDANVLMNALRKRGYTVTLQREIADGMIHVRIGPFSSRDEADKWRMKLLNDGYNAIVQP